MEKLGGIRPELHDAIEAALDNCLSETDLGIGHRTVVRPGWPAAVGLSAFSRAAAMVAVGLTSVLGSCDGERRPHWACYDRTKQCAEHVPKPCPATERWHSGTWQCKSATNSAAAKVQQTARGTVPFLVQGKVRDTYATASALVIVTTDRQSAFDRLLSTIPFKGQVLNQTAAWWFEKTRHIVDNAVLATPDPNVTVMRPCTVFPVELVVRGFMTGAPLPCSPCSGVMRALPIDIMSGATGTRRPSAGTYIGSIVFGCATPC